MLLMFHNHKKNEVKNRLREEEAKKHYLFHWNSKLGIPIKNRHKDNNNDKTNIAGIK